MIHAAPGLLPGPSSGEDRFRELAEVVEVPLEDLPERGSSAPFKAWVEAPGTPVGELLLRGILWRLGEGALDAFCLLCPHEICEVERVTDAAAVRRDAAVTLPEPPLLVCPCHFSVFDPERGGERVAGPAPRGLYRFGLEIAGDRVRIDRVEASLVDRFAVPEPTPGGP
jgi:Rieske Fe-S protein